ncbi:sensor domain-containing diguanylate cyclase [Alteromonas sp. RW2A1]|uniref:sensor domain-containing diguanylate cyclase n=1 Tax=Alteromonas sp. RW2A1 TaxID=1917158 RepID=UPI0009F92A5D|nr:sensor domain-containing diguanylate cyclase [Alteromonas sp. RW2A1]
MTGRNFFNSRLSFALLKKILLITCVITSILTVVQLLLSYLDEKEALSKFLSELETVHSEALARNVFEINNEAAQSIIDGMLSYDAIGYVSVSIKEQDGVKIIEAGERTSSAAVASRQFPIVFVFANLAMPVGTVEIQSDANYLYDHIKQSFFVILTTQIIKTFLVSGILLILFHRLIISRIDAIHRWLVSYSAEDNFTPLAFTNSKSSNDEIDELKDEINIVGKSLQRSTQELEILVEQRTEELKKANLKLEKLAYTDSLTGVANRSALLNKSEEELRRSRRLGYDMGVMMLDLDNFKSVNDNYGHDAGDKVLKSVAQAVNNSLRKDETLGRLGGEEFVVIVHGADKVGMQQLAGRIQDVISLQDFSFLREGYSVTVSIGYTKVEKNEQFKSALKRADSHLYTAKANGRNCCVTDSEIIPKLVK